jgi:hypothetical protein
MASPYCIKGAMKTNKAATLYGYTVYRKRASFHSLFHFKHAAMTFDFRSPHNAAEGDENIFES